jgi:hypothetical protein
LLVRERASLRHLGRRKHGRVGRHLVDRFLGSLERDRLERDDRQRTVDRGYGARCDRVGRS